MPALSLLQLSTATAIRNVKYLNDIGNIPYSLARPFLLKIESPEKLRSLELTAPHIMKDDVELWLEFIKRDIPRWEEYDLPEESDCWYEVYCSLLERVQKSVEEDAERLKMALDGINSERAKHSAKFVTDRRTIRLPQERPTAKQRYASYDRKMGGLSPVFVSAPRSGAPTGDPLSAPVWAFERPQLPRAETTPTKKKSSIFAVPKRNSALAVPTNQLNNRATQVKQAPISLIEEHRRPQGSTVAGSRKHPPVIAPGRSMVNRSTFGSSPASISPSLRERETRLRALTTGNTSSPKPTSSSPAEPSALSRDPPQASHPAAKPSSKSMGPSSAARDPSVSSPVERRPPSQLPKTPNHEHSTTNGSTIDKNLDGAGSRVPAERPARPMVMRKRRPASILIQPKKKKVA